MQKTESVEKSSGVYFPSLNGVRFVAALGVIMHHLEQHKHIFGLKNVYTNSFVGGVFGRLGIIMFFVLSGFLITYLLLKEKEKTGRISVKHFYIRRMLRIWPLYYLIVIMGLFLIPYIPFFNVPGRTEFIHDHFGIKIFFLVFFMPNIIDSIYRATPIPYTDQVWSVGVEEQFYFAWPWLVKYSKNLFKTLSYIIIGYFVIKFTFEFLYYIYPDNWYFDNANYFMTFFCIDDISLGGLMACALYYKKEKMLKFLFNKYVQIFTYLSLAVITVKGIAVPHITYEVYAIFFAVMIINLAANPKTIISFENKILSYLGKITYGLYLYHYIAIVAAIKLGMRYVDPNNLVLSNIAYYGFTFGLCIIMAVISYEFFEKRFLRAKVKFSAIVSGDNAKEMIEESQTVQHPAINTNEREIKLAGIAE
ncbi:MAG: acyltransferase [Bacteroidetes bacterium]|nr:acyltransferase [Bacteroidota bacterium]